MRHFNTLVYLLIAWLLSGCAVMREPSEVAWQTVHLIDTLQTFHLAKDSRYKEVESAWLIGEYPNEETLLAWSVGSSLIHAGVTHLLMENEFPKLSKLWQYITLSSLCNTVGQNAAIGIRIGGPNVGPESQWNPIDDRSKGHFGLRGR